MLILLGFAAALRRSELAVVQREHLTVTPEGLRLLIPCAKGDQAGIRTMRGNVRRAKFVGENPAGLVGL